MNPKIFVAAMIMSICLISSPSYPWDGDPWESISRQTITSIANEMIDSYWTPRNTIYNWTYDSRDTFYFGTIYTGIAYCLKTTPDNWDEFFLKVNITSGGNTAYGNDCSGFASICWRLGTRYKTWDFEADATTDGGYCHKLGDVGTAPEVNLLQGDALVKSGTHILLFDRYADFGGIISMEQTSVTDEKRRYWSWSKLGNYRPIRRNLIEDESETLSVTLTANPSSGTAPLSVDFTATVSGTATGTINYTFYSNRSDAGIDITPGYCFKIDGRNPDGTGGTIIYQGIATGYSGGTTFTVYNVCNYITAGTYTAKVIAERGSAPPAEDRVTITVNEPTFTISGYVRTSGGSGISDVVMNGLPSNPSTSSSGYYSGTVNYGWSGTMTPTKTGYSFSPPSTSYSNVTSNQSTNYTGTLQTFSISGYVRTSVGSGISGVVMNGLPGNPSTDANSYYSGTVDYGWSGTVTPQKAGYTFNPPSKSYSNVTSNQTQDYTGTVHYSISGYVRKSDNTPVSGVTMTLSEHSSGTTITNSGGYYQFTNLEGGYNYTVTPSKSGWTFSPPSGSYTPLNSDQTDQNYTGNAIPSIPTDLTPDSTSWITSTSITFKARVSDPDGDMVKAYFDFDGGASDGWGLMVASENYSELSCSASDGQWKFRCKARDEHNAESGWSEWANFWVDHTSPQSFSLVSPEDSLWLNTQTPMFLWRPSSDATSGIKDYLIYLDGEVKDSTTDTTWNSTYDLSEGNHSWYIEARDNAGLLIQSNETFMVGIDTTSPSSFDLASPSDSLWTNILRPVFIWRASLDLLSGLKDYKIYVGGTLADSTTDTTWICNYDLSEGNHVWFVTAYDIAGNFSYSNDIWTVRIDTTEPDISTLISPDSGTTTNNDTPQFVWHSAADNLGGTAYYTLEYADNPGFSGKASVHVSDTIYTSSPLSDTIYYWHVKAIDRAANESGWSDVWSFEVDTDIPNAPTLISPSNNSWFYDSAIVFGWNAVTKLKEGNKTSPISYVLQIDTTDSFSSPVFVDTTETTADTVNLSEDYYYWRVMAFDLAGNVSGFSAVWEFGIDTTPPISFNLISLEDSASLTITRPTFVWQASSDSGCGLKDYEVYIDRALKHTGVDTFWTTDYDLSEDYHSWYVIAYDSVDNSRQSNQTWTVLIDTTAPSVVLLLSPSNNSYLGDSTVNFIWNSATDDLSSVDYYILHYTPDGSFSSGVIETTTVDTTFTVVLSDTIYYWRTKVVDKASNESDWSSIWSFEIDTEVPETPSLISPIGGEYLDTTAVIFEWSEATKGIVGSKQYGVSSNVRQSFSLVKGEKYNTTSKSSEVRYVLQVDTFISFTNPMVVDTLTSDTDTIEMGEENYYWRVKAYDLAGNEGEFSAPDSFGVDTTSPSIPELISPEDGWVTNDTLVTCVWHSSTDNLSGIDYYTLIYNHDKSWMEVDVYDTSHTLHCLPNIMYSWTVRAVDVAGNEGKCAEWRDFEVDTDIPDTPELLLPEDSTYLSNIIVAFEWSEILKGTVGSKQYGVECNKGQGFGFASGRDNTESKSSPIHYILQVDTTSEFKTPVVDTTNIPFDTLTLDEYLYYWRVRAYDGAGNEGDFSQAFWFVVDTTSPVIDSITQLQDTVDFWGPFTVETKISDNFYIKDAILYFKVNNSGWISYTMVSPGGRWYRGRIPEQTPADTLTIDYYITASDCAENMSRDPKEGNYSFTIFLTGIQETRDIPDRFILFSPKPNPSLGMVEIQYGLSEKTNIALQIYDIQGRLVKSIFSGSKDAGYYKLHINSRDLSSGIYFLRFEAKGFNTTRKLLIIK